MESKKFKHNKVEKCGLCDKEIATIIEEWCAIVDFKGKEQRKVGFYHNKCYKDLIEAKGKVIEQNFTEKVNNMVKKLFNGKLGDMKEYEFKTT